MILTPEEKAKMLVNKFKYYTRAFNETNGWEDCSYNAKQCALINVNEMYNMASELDSIKYMNYLTDVETEIKKL
jgi:hypothetical protein